MVLDDPGWWDRWSEVGWKSGVSWWDGVSIDRDKALVGLRHSHWRPGLHRGHLTLRGDSLGLVEVPSSRGSSVAGVAEVADGAGTERGGLGGSVASAPRGRAGAGMGRMPLPGPQASMDLDRKSVV